MKLTLTFLLVASALRVCAGDSKSPRTPSPGDWQFSLSMGAGVRSIGSLRMNTGYRSGGQILPSFVGGDSLILPPVGEKAIGERFYNDGYVRQDASTGVDGLTQFWGYDNPGQVQSDQLAFSATGAESVYRDRFNVPSAGPSRRNSLSGFSPHIQLDVVSPHQVGGFKLGFSSAFDCTSVDQSLAFSNWSGQQARDDFRLDYEDRYDLEGVIPPIAPYAGSFGGGGALIGNVPTNRSITPVLVFTDIAGFSNQVLTSIDVDVFSVTAGPSLSRSWGRAGLALQGGLIFSLYSWEASQAEELNVSSAAGETTQTSWVESDSGNKFRVGLYVQADLTYDVDANLRVGSYLRLDTASEFRAQAGPTVFKIDPSGINAGFQIRYTFP